MGGFCSKESEVSDYGTDDEASKEKESSKSSVPIKLDLTNPVTEGSEHSKHKPGLERNGSSVTASKVEDDGKTRTFERPRGGHRRGSTVDLGMSRVVSMPDSVRGEQSAAGWPTWLSAVAAEAIHGWLPRSADSFEKLNKIGQGTYSSVYKARDLTNNKIVAMKKVRFVNMDAESVRFMSREICILRRLDHPNVMKLEAVVTSTMSGSLYLVFEYMEHDLSGLAIAHGSKFTESQIKCYMQQLLSGLDHCHSRGVLHRDIKGSNLLLNDNGIMKIGDLGLATIFYPDQKQPLTSRVVTLWYRAPELLLGETNYGVAIDMWSAGCILAELFAGKPIMPGRTEVEQVHKIFKLCGSPSEEYWQKTRLPLATSFKPQQPYTRCVTDTFKDFPPSALTLLDTLLSIEPEERGTAASALSSAFFTTKPPPCDPSCLPKYPPSKELDARIRDEKERRKKAESVKGRRGENRKKNSRESNGPPAEFNAQRQGQSNNTPSRAGFHNEPPPENYKNGITHSNSVIHPNACSRKEKDVGGQTVHRLTHHGGEMLSHGFQKTRHVKELSSTLRDQDTGVYVPKRNRIHCSGPLMPPGGNMEDMLREHERQILEAVRKAKTKNK
ncbi:PREDICTED: probable serine/threonine-protein kinase At1g09600 isoform X2 [Ipomoea nil]|uniref:probable serine/threonine-protein kinase At1g09600 isoform X2 n=1 Tax=Ipomoea nil TaxID=35883 RepID=UPI0009014EE2|nr:PREDICTED: probable serine/threonine-protein kinase At1g09600 isoform X2 [Ipomoea nil]